MPQPAAGNFMQNNEFQPVPSTGGAPEAKQTPGQLCRWCFIRRMQRAPAEHSMDVKDQKHKDVMCAYG
jgi:hypothetical protein